MASEERDFIPASRLLIKGLLATYSEETARSQGCAVTVTDNQVIQKPNIDQFEGRFQASGDAFVGLTRFCDPGRMIVRHNQYTLPMTSNTIPEPREMLIISRPQRSTSSLDIPEYCGYASGYFGQREKQCL